MWLGGGEGDPLLLCSILHVVVEQGGGGVGCVQVVLWVIQKGIRVCVVCMDWACNGEFVLVLVCWSYDKVFEDVFCVCEVWEGLAVGWVGSGVDHPVELCEPCLHGVGVVGMLRVQVLGVEFDLLCKAG